MASVYQEGDYLPFTAGTAAHEVVHLKLSAAIQPPALERDLTQIIQHKGLKKPVVFVVVGPKALMGIPSNFGFARTMQSMGRDHPTQLSPEPPHPIDPL